MRKLVSLILIISTFVCSFASDPAWKIHPVFDEEVTHVIDTPSFVYFTSKNMAENEWNEVFQSLFRYDKKGEELLPLSTSNLLNGNSIRDIVYNSRKGYLAVLYKDYNIDLLYNDGKVFSIPYYSLSSLSYDKKVNSLIPDPEKDRLYLATDFGYLAINDKKNEIAESRIYGEPLHSFCRIGNLYFALKGNDILSAPVSSHRLSLEDYTTLASFHFPKFLVPLGEDICLLIGGENKKKYVKRISYKEGDLISEDILEGEIINYEYTQEGVSLTTEKDFYIFKKDGTFTNFDLPSDFYGNAVGSSNSRDFWFGQKRKGLAGAKKTDDWVITHPYMLPNSPSPYASVSFSNHPDKGLLVLNYGYNPQTIGLCESIPFQLSSYKRGRWQNLAPAYTDPARTNIMMMTNGLAIDPENSSYVYVTSVHNGIVRLNLDNPRDILHLSRANDTDAKNPGFVTMIPASRFLPYFANFSAPKFDSQGNLWMNYAEWDDQSQPNPHLYCWTPSDRRVSSSVSDINLPQLVEVDYEVPVSNTAFVVPLIRTGKGLLIFARSHYNESLLLIDTNATPLETNDDKVYAFTEFKDSDGNLIDLHNIRHIWEDPSTGYVWICHLEGVCYFIPSQVVGGNYELHRVKVARNDGTQFADYLLDGVTVNQVISDAEGRKWFSTAGAGIICTTSDGKEIIAEYNSENSPLPDDVVYGTGYNSETNSLMISTAQGFAEYSLPSGGHSSSAIEVRAFPNPVRPEFTGYVTITDIPQGSLVKIVDVKGNLVKELGIVSGFDILWDLSDSKFQRVKSGVYHILVSPGDGKGSSSAVGKILVVS